MRPVVSVGLTLIDKTVCVITKNINNQRPLKMKNDVYIFVWADLPKMFGWAVIEPVWQVLPMLSSMNDNNGCSSYFSLSMIRF